MTDTETAPARSIGLRGIAVVLVGAFFLLASFSVLEWYPGSTEPSAIAHIHFADLHDMARLDASPTLSAAYFDRLAWLLLLAAIAVGFAANLPTPASGLLRMVGVAIGLGGVAATYYALDGLARLNEGDYPLHHASAGIWLTFVGYLLVAVGAALGPPRRR
jgi:hypothetical protein